MTKKVLNPLIFSLTFWQTLCPIYESHGSQPIKEVVEVLNETIHDGSNEKSYAIMWDEMRGGARGANKVASSILK